MPTPDVPQTFTFSPIPTGGYTLREHWLTDLAKQSERFFVGLKLPPYRVTVGWPLGGALSTKRQVLGQCFGSEVSTGNIHELFITPVIDEPMYVAGVLIHEMTHVIAGVDAGHKGRFTKIAKQIGLTKGKPTTALSGDKLSEYLQKVVDRLGPYPHKAIKPTLKKKEKEVKALTLSCEACECKIRMSIKWMSEAGIPTCACSGVFIPQLLKGEQPRSTLPPEIHADA